MADLSKDERHILNLLTKKRKLVRVICSDGGLLYWYNGGGGWNNPEMHPMQDHYVLAVNALLSQGILEVTDDRAAALLMAITCSGGRRITACAGKWSGGRFIGISTSWPHEALSGVAGNLATEGTTIQPT